MTSSDDRRRILFVDDEPHMISGLKRMLFHMDCEWDMDFSTSGAQALKLMAEANYDVVVSDIRMPGMDGAELFTRIRNEYPKTARIAFSGQVDRDTTMKLAGPTHQYLAKPSDADALISSIRRVCAMRDVLRSESLVSVVTRLDRLPSLPTLYVEIMQELESPSSSIARVGEIIEKDIAMTAKVLQLVNSAFFGIPQRITSPRHAVAMLGLETITSLVITIHIATQFKSLEIEGFSLKELWDHSVRTATYAREISIRHNADKSMADQAFMAGMLHDVGKLIFASSLPEKYRQTHRFAIENEISLTQAESEVFGANHAEVGGYLLGIWGLPDEVVEAALFHSSPAASPTNSFSPLTAVHVGDVEANAVALGPDESDADESDADGKDVAPGRQIDLEYLERIQMIDRLPEWQLYCQGKAETLKDMEQVG